MTLGSLHSPRRVSHEGGSVGLAAGDGLTAVTDVISTQNLRLRLEMSQMNDTIVALTSRVEEMTAHSSRTGGPRGGPSYRKESGRDKVRRRVRSAKGCCTVQ